MTFIVPKLYLGLLGYLKRGTITIVKIYVGLLAFPSYTSDS